MGILAFFLLMITWVPGILLVLILVILAGDLTFVRANPHVLPAITVFAFVEVFLVSVAILALSSLSSSSRAVAVVYLGLMLFSEAVFGILRIASGDTQVSWVSPLASLAQVGDVVFQMSPRYETPWPVSLAVILGVSAVAVLVLHRRVRGIEVVT